MGKICKSCAGPLSDYKKADLINPDFCPYCVDRRGKLKSYKEILDGMIDYLKNDHPEITEAKRSSAAKEMLENESPIWGQKWTGTIIKESLSNTKILDKYKVLSVKKEKQPEDESLSGGYEYWHLYNIEFPRTEFDAVIYELKQSIKSDYGWWVNLNSQDEKDVCIVFPGKSFLGNSKDKEFAKEVNVYASMIGCPESQWPIQG